MQHVLIVFCRCVSTVSGSFLSILRRFSEPWKLMPTLALLLPPATAVLLRSAHRRCQRFIVHGIHLQLFGVYRLLTPFSLILLGGFCSYQWDPWEPTVLALSTGHGWTHSAKYVWFLSAIVLNRIAHMTNGNRMFVFASIQSLSLLSHFICAITFHNLMIIRFLGKSFFIRVRKFSKNVLARGCWAHCARYSNRQQCSEQQVVTWLLHVDLLRSKRLLIEAPYDTTRHRTTSTAETDCFRAHSMQKHAPSVFGWF